MYLPMIMKRHLSKKILILSTIIFYGCIVLLATSSLAEASDTSSGSQNIKDIFIDIKAGKRTIVEAFKLIESKTDLLINYEEKDIDHSISIQFNSGRTSVSNMLTTIAKESNLRFRQINQTINVMRQQNKTIEKPAIEILIDGVIVTGRVTTAEDGSGLPGVNVIVKGTQLGTITNHDGDFKLEVPTSASILVFSSIGFIISSCKLIPII